MILVTGGTGLVGAQLLLDLTVKGNKVRAISRSSSSKLVVNRTFKNQPHLLDLIEWVDADILDPRALKSALANIKTVYHSAAYVSFDNRYADKVLETNITGTANLVNACLDMNVEQFCHFSSVSALGTDTINGKITESSAFKNSKYNSTYAISKHGSEREVWRAIAEGLNAVILSPTIIFGRGNWQTGSSAIFPKIYKGFPFYTLGSSGFVDVRDVTNIAIQLITKNITGEKYIVCSENLTYKEIFSLIAKCFNKKPPYIKPPNWVNKLFWRLEYLRSRLSGHPPVITRETARSAIAKKVFSNEKIKAELNYDFIPVEQSIKDTCKLFLEDISETS